jgi:hypothetical protein
MNDRCDSTYGSPQNPAYRSALAHFVSNTRLRLRDTPEFGAEERSGRFLRIASRCVNRHIVLHRVIRQKPRESAPPENGSAANLPEP